MIILVCHVCRAYKHSKVDILKTIKNTNLTEWNVGRTISFQDMKQKIWKVRFLKPLSPLAQGLRIGTFVQSPNKVTKSNFLYLFGWLRGWTVICHDLDLLTRLKRSKRHISTSQTKLTSEIWMTSSYTNLSVSHDSKPTKILKLLL